MIDENYSKEMAQYIFNILMANPIVAMSWGIDPSTIEVVNLGVKFHVQGFKHNGFVQIVLNEGADLFEVTLISNDGEVLRTIDSIYLDQLVDVIDDAVEHTENYEEKIKDEYGF